jgi:hypothetical protein
LATANNPRRKLGYLAIPLFIGLMVLFEAWHFVHFFRVFTFSALALLLADIAWLNRERTRDVFVMLTSLAIGLIIIEGVSDSMMHRANGTAAQRGSWSPGEPIIGWGPNAAGRYRDYRIDSAGRTIYDVNYTIDRNLLRQTLSCKKGPPVVFFGCSYTFGDGVNDNETLPQYFANLTDRRMRVLNLGFTGYGPQQFLREEETGRFDDAIGPDPKLFVFLTAVWHAERTACKAYWTARAPRYALENGKLVYVGQCNPAGPSLWLRDWLENTALYREFVEPSRSRLTHDDIDLYVRILDAAVQLAKKKYNASTVVLYLRSDDSFFRGTGFSDDEIMQRLRDGGAIVVDASLVKEQKAGAQISIVGDGHPTPYANQLRASMLKTYLAEHAPGLLQSTPDPQCSGAQ